MFVLFHHSETAVKPDFCHIVELQLASIWYTSDLIIKKKVNVHNESPVYLVKMSLNTPNESNYIIFLIIIQHHIALQV